MPDYNKEERKLARKWGLRLINNSGRGKYAKGDAEDEDFLYDIKITSKKSFPVNLEKYKKHRKDAWDKHKDAGYIIQFTEEDHAVAVIDWYVLQGMLDDLRKLREIEE